MTAWQIIRTHLAGDVAVTALATGGIYPVRGKQEEVRPMIVGRQMSGQDDESLTERLMASATLEIGCVAKNYDDAVALYEAAKTSLRAMRKQTVAGKLVHHLIIGGTRDEDNPETAWYGIVFAVDIKHQI